MARDGLMAARPSQLKTDWEKKVRRPASFDAGQLVADLRGPVLGAAEHHLDHMVFVCSPSSARKSAKA